MFSSRDVKIANATSRANGAVGRKARVPKFVQSIANKRKDTILDFGSGKTAAHARNLRRKGFKVTAHEFGGNRGKYHDPKALSRKYSIVYASNVINVQNSKKMLKGTLNQIARATKHRAILNLPKSPRKGAWSGNNRKDFHTLEHHLRKRFKTVNRTGEMFDCRK